MKTPKVLLGIAAAGLALSLAACSGAGGGRAGTGGNDGGDTKGALIGVAMPTQTSERWIDDGNNVKAKLEVEMAAATKDPAVKARFEDIGFDVGPTLARSSRSFWRRRSRSGRALWKEET